MEEGKREEEYGTGAGGKLTKRSWRSTRMRAQSTPYHRPTQTINKDGGGWFSKLLVQPASRILQLPSLFSSSSTASSSYLSRHQDQDQFQDQDQSHSLPEIEQEGATVSTPHSDLQNQFFVLKESGASPKTSQPKAESKDVELVGYSSDGFGIAEIELRLQQKKFSRDEANRLLELLQSRTAALPHEEGDSAGLKLEASEGTQGQKDLRISTKKNSGVQLDCRMTLRTSDHLQFTAHDVSSSPVEIAKAYMEARTSASDYDCQTGKLKNDKITFCDDNSASKVAFTSVVKSPMCWPGAVVQNDHGYFTPRRGSIGHRPRTPYSGDLFSKSTNKFQVNAERAERSLAGRSSTPVFCANMMPKRMNSVLDDGFASIGSIHHVPQKNIGTLSKGVDEAARFTASSPTVHPQSSKLARKILRHLDRSVLSPKEKLLEIKLARSGIPQKSETHGQHHGPDVSTSYHQKTSCFFAQESVEVQKVVSGTSTGTFNDKDRLSIPPQTCKQGNLGLVQGATANSAAFQIQQNLPHSSFEKSIPTAKFSEKLKGRDDGFSFTFPVSAATTVFSEPPPTPTMASSLTASSTLEASEGSIPSFSFGPSKSSDRLVFSFGSTVSSSSSVDRTTPNFKFGTEKKCCVSFKSIGMPSAIKNY